MRGRPPVDDAQLQRILNQFDGVRPSGSGYSARCPAHDDHVNSLSLSNGATAGVVLHCHAGCDTASVMAAVGMSMADLAGTPQLVAEYPYHDSDGRVIYTVQRWSPKTFRVRPGLPVPAERVLFGAQWITYARETGQMLYIVEGERDALTLINMGIPATTNVSGAGAGKWLPHYADQVAGCAVTIISDNDEVGKQHARTIAQSIAATAKSVITVVPGFGKDVTELITAGYTLDHLLPLEEAQPLPVIKSTNVQVRKVEWVWPGYFPRGKLSTLEGDPGDGKSTLTIDLVSRWSTGAAMPDGVAHDGPYTALMISAEDEPEDTVVPRLIAAGADLRRVHLLSSGTDPQEPFNLGTDMEALEHTITNLGIDILTLDPLSSFLPDNTDSYSDHKVRRALYPLHLLARRCNVAIIAVRHLSKSATKAIYAGNGSIGIIAAARAAFLVGSIPDDEDSGDRVLAPIKCNLSAKPPALRYRIQLDPLRDVGRVTWDGQVDTLSAQDVMDGDKGRSERLTRDDARDYLTQICDRSPMTWREIASRGKADGYSEITLRRVRGAVLAKAIHPIMPGGERMQGTYWIRIEQMDTFRDRFEHLLTCTAPPAHEQVRKQSTQSDEQPKPGTESEAEPEADPEAELYLRERVCDVCRSAEAVVFPAPHYAIRCRAHDPRRWTAP